MRPAPASPIRPATTSSAAGDVLHITVYQSPDLTLDTRVTESGTITYPLLGTLKLGGLSVAQAEATIARGLRDGQFVKEPQVTLMVTQVRGNQVSALGRVNKPGRYSIDVVGMRLSELLALAGGIAPDGNDVVALTGAAQRPALPNQVDVPTLYAGQARQRRRPGAAQRRRAVRRPRADGPHLR